MGEKQSALGIVLFFGSMIFTMIPVAIGLALFAHSLPSSQRRELSNLALMGLYLSWILFPIFGYRINESFDGSKLLLYPISAFRIYLAGLLSSFFDLSSLLLIPPLLAVAVAHGTGPHGLLPPLFVALLFLLHTLSIGQFLLFLMRQLLRHRGFWDFMVVVVPIVSIVLLMFSQAIFAFFASGVNGVFDYESPLDIPFSRVIAFFPPGVAANALEALEQGNDGDAIYWVLLMLSITVLTFVIASHFCSKVLHGEYDDYLTAKEKDKSKKVGWDFLFEVLRRGFSSRPIIPALVIKELQLITREPQYRMIIILDLIMLLAMIVFISIFSEREEIVLVFEFLFISSFFVFGGLYFNVLAVERSGLRLLLTAPVTAFTLLGTKSIALCLIVFGCNGFAIVLAGFLLRLSLGLIWVNLCFGLVLLLMIAGLGNIVSVLTPTPLPSGGVALRRPISFGRVFVMSLLISLAISLCFVLISPIVLALSLAYALDLNYFLMKLSLISLLYALGIWGLSTLLASDFFERKRELLLAEILD